MEGFIKFISVWVGHWISQVFIVIFLSLLLDFIQKLVLSKLHQKLQATRTFWDHIIVDALRAPLSFFIWLMGICIAFQIIQEKSDSSLFSAVEPLRRVGIIAALTWFVIRLIKRAEEELRIQLRHEEKKIDKTTLDAVGKILRASVLITSFLVTLQTLGFSISGILTFGGIGGIAIGFASKDLLANFFGTFIVYWDRPFKVGDWVCLPEKHIEGFVEQIGWRVTCIRKLDRRPLYVPNAIFSSVTVENPSRMTHRRIVETIGIRYCDIDRLPLILEGVRALLKELPTIDSSELRLAYFDQYSPSSLDFSIYCFTRETSRAKFVQVKEELLLKIHEIIQKHGAEVAFPTSTVYMEQVHTPALKEPTPPHTSAPKKSVFQPIDQP